MTSNLSAKEAKTHFGLLLDMAQRSPVTVEKKGRPVVVVLSLQDFSRYEQLEDELLALKAMQAEKEGWLDQDESADFLTKLGVTKVGAAKKRESLRCHAKNTNNQARLQAVKTIAAKARFAIKK